MEYKDDSLSLNFVCSHLLYVQLPQIHTVLKGGENKRRYLFGIKLIRVVSGHVFGKTIGCEAPVYGRLDDLLQGALGVHAELA